MNSVYHSVNGLSKKKERRYTYNRRKQILGIPWIFLLFQTKFSQFLLLIL